MAYLAIDPELDVGAPRFAARADWARSNGLEPGDGPYLTELRLRPLSLRQLGEALAIHGETREMIGFAVERLVFGGFMSIDAVW